MKKMDNERNLQVEVERIKGDIKLIQYSIKTIETNHLAHIQKSIQNINRILWTVGFMIFGQLIIVIRDLLF
tara:strand:- start:1658 stop:1870 length:213 start_codon:yes stop_codon:yes gene_type:complete